MIYPSAYAVQSEVDAAMVETLFGIPDYRYKVWLARHAVQLLTAAVLLVGLASFCRLALTDFAVHEMVFHLMFPVAFLSSAGFLLATLTRGGNGALAVLVLVVARSLDRRRAPRGQPLEPVLQPLQKPLRPARRGGGPGALGDHLPQPRLPALRVGPGRPRRPAAPAAPRALRLTRLRGQTAMSARMAGVAPVAVQLEVLEDEVVDLALAAVADPQARPRQGLPAELLAHGVEVVQVDVAVAEGVDELVGHEGR